MVVKPEVVATWTWYLVWGRSEAYVHVIARANAGVVPVAVIGW